MSHCWDNPDHDLQYNHFTSGAVEASLPAEMMGVFEGLVTPGPLSDTMVEF